VIEAAGPADPEPPVPASVPPEDPASGDPASGEEGNPCKVRRIPFVTPDQVALTATLPGPQRAGSMLTSHA